VIPLYVKLPYPHFKKKPKEKDGSHFKKIMDMFTKLMKDLLSKKKQQPDDNNIALSK
jgi:hypothetical protein